MSTEVSTFFAGDGKRELTNFKGDGIEKWKFISKVTQEEGIPAIKSKGEIIAVVYWYIHEVEVTNERSQRSVKAIRTVLVDDKGNAFTFVSDGIYQSLRTMIYAMGEGPYDPPLYVVVREGESKGRRRFYYLEPAPDGR